MKVALYARVSTTDQTAESQLHALRSHARQRGWEVAGEYVDTGYSGMKDKRPALDKLMKDTWSGKFDAVVVFRFDRFARSTKHLLAALDTFRSLNVGFISISEQIDTTTPLGQAVFTILGAIAQLERDIIRERVKSGLARAKTMGVHIGRPPRKNINVAEVEKLAAEGLSLRKIAKLLGVPRSTLLGRLNNQVMPNQAANRER